MLNYEYAGFFSSVVFPLFFVSQVIRRLISLYPPVEVEIYKTREKLRFFTIHRNSANDRKSSLSQHENPEKKTWTDLGTSSRFKERFAGETKFQSAKNGEILPRSEHEIPLSVIVIKSRVFFYLFFFLYSTRNA